LAASVFLATTGCGVSGQLSPLLPLERAMVFQPAPYPSGDWTPSGLAFEDAWFQAEDGTQLLGWYVSHSHPRAVALFCPGNSGNVAAWADTLRTLNVRHRLAVMSLDYRGYGRSAGTPSERGILQDARAARRWVAQRSVVAESDVVLIGQSLGGGVAVDLAARDGARALVLSRTFTSLPDVGASHMPWLLPHWNMTMRMDSLSKIVKYHGPVLIRHGDEDEVIPFAHAEALYKAVPGQKRLFRESGGRHNDRPSEAYHVALEEFLTVVERN
jgi:fermentation-respiration switch protein FrsA (DUF1100 family)